MASVDEQTSKFPILAVVAATIAFLLALSGLWGAFHQPFLLLSAIVPCVAGVFIVRRRSAAAYGFALFELLQGTLILPSLAGGAHSRERIQLLVALGLSIVLAVLFFFAGRALDRMGAPRGLLWPWVVVASLFSLPFFFVRAYVTPSGSMQNTLLLGDHVLVRTFPRGTPARGDILVFHYPLDRSQIYVKRVIGIPGDRIHIVARDVYRNGEKLAEPYVIHAFPPDKFRDNLPPPPGAASFLPNDILSAAKEMLTNHVQNGEVVVPPGKYFVLGDNRDNSLDSRYWGFLDGADIIGQPFLIYQSESKDPKGKTHVRWNRMLKVL